MKFKSEKETVFHFLFFSLFAREEIEMERGKKGAPISMCSFWYIRDGKRIYFPLKFFLGTDLIIVIIFEFLSSACRQYM
jgi:hypothetical protein